MGKRKIYDKSFSERMELIVEKSFNGNQSKFALAVGVAQASLARWVKGEADPSRTNLVKIAEVTGVSLEWLAIGEMEEQAINSLKPRDYTIKEALQILEKAINSQQKVVGLELTDSELNLVKGYRLCNKIEQEKIGVIIDAFANLHNQEKEKSKAKDVA